MDKFPYDPWQKCKTISGLDADLVISAVQKEIRRYKRGYGRLPLVPS